MVVDGFEFHSDVFMICPVTFPSRAVRWPLAPTHSKELGFEPRAWLVWLTLVFDYFCCCCFSITALMRTVSREVSLRLPRSRAFLAWSVIFRGLGHALYLTHTFWTRESSTLLEPLQHNLQLSFWNMTAKNFLTVITDYLNCLSSLGAASHSHGLQCPCCPDRKWPDWDEWIR